MFLFCPALNRHTNVVLGKPVYAIVLKIFRVCSESRVPRSIPFQQNNYSKRITSAVKMGYLFSKNNSKIKYYDELGISEIMGFHNGSYEL